MKSKLAIAVLAIVAIALLVLLTARDQRARHEKTTLEAGLAALSNDVRQTHQKWVEQTKVNQVLDTDLTVRSAELTSASNRVLELTNLLVKSQSEAQALSQTLAQTIETSRQEAAKRDSRIQELEGEKDQMTKRMSELGGEIDQLAAKISDTERKLAAAEGDKNFLVKELKRLQSEKMELERQFNDLAILREQVKKLREELSLAKRIEWIRRGLYGSGSDMKGAEKLVRGFVPSQAKTNFDLNVEIKRDGGAKVAAPEEKK